MRHRLAGITGDDVEREVNGVQLDMGDGVQQRYATLDAVEGAALDGGRRNEFRFIRPARTFGQG